MLSFVYLLDSTYGTLAHTIIDLSLVPYVYHIMTMCYIGFLFSTLWERTRIYDQRNFYRALIWAGVLREIALIANIIFAVFVIVHMISAYTIVVRIGRNEYMYVS